MFSFCQWFPLPCRIFSVWCNPTCLFFQTVCLSVPVEFVFRKRILQRGSARHFSPLSSFQSDDEVLLSLTYSEESESESDYTTTCLGHTDGQWSSWGLDPDAVCATSWRPSVPTAWASICLWRLCLADTKPVILMVIASSQQKQEVTACEHWLLVY